MDTGFEEKYHRIEDTYWWFRARRDYLVRLIRGPLRVPPEAQILDIGCSGGALLSDLHNCGYKNLHGIDVSPAAIEICQGRGCAVVRVMDATQPDYPDNTFDLVIAGDVLEHLEHADAALKQWRRILKPGGTLIVLVPAFMFLWTSHDDVNHHFRRYRLGQLRRDLGRQGFTLPVGSYWNFSLFAPIAAIRILMRAFSSPRRPATDQDVSMPRWLNSTLVGLLSLENTLLLHGLRFPVGVSALAIAVKQ
jgi:SAM-dependent methyltransferase